MGLSALLVLSAPALLIGTGGVFSITKHGDPTTGVQRDPNLPRGECGQCHVSHAGTSPQPFALFSANTNALCYTSGCHSTSGAQNIYQGPLPYDASAHGTNSNMMWPGFDASVDASAPRARPSGDWGKCVNCHDPHGYNRDGSGLIPSLVVSREDKICIVCHDGSPSTKNIKNEINKTYRHPIATSGKHSVAENGTSSAFGISATNNRHAECVDCHNAHIAKPNTFPPSPPDASDRIRGVSRVSVTNGAAGSTPIFTYRGPSDTTPPIAEYQVCFKCHSAWTTQPGGQTDLSVRFNNNNPSYHPVEAQGRNININANAFINNWDGTKLMYCTDCHTSDDSNIRGPHGSQYQYILKKAFTASSGQRTMFSTELCFECHRYDTYANKDAGNTIKGYSRFNPPTFEKGHAFHVGDRRYPCYACHDSHGSTTRPHLIITGRNPGINSYTETSTGGTCSPTCHSSQTYNINYSR
ncbi:MAG: hypothetical protein HY695_02190 [Deltaproteobacteria bacterium]|nr:hypothetical protein [Deltaproteobacteria bacterium]